jgi:plasmid stabilization system protein ParE
MQRQFRYYLVELDAPEVAVRFLDSVEDAFRVIIRNPGIGSQRPFPNLPGLRSWPVPGFEDIRVYYVQTPGVLRIVRVLHGSRDLGRILKKEENPIH